MRQSGAETLVTEEPDAFIAHVRVCGGAGWVTIGSTRKPTASSVRSCLAPTSGGGSPRALGVQVETQLIPGYPPRQEEKTMTTLLQQAFEKASQLPDDLQDQLAQDLLDDIAGELQWDTTLAHSEDLLEQLAEQALREFEAGRTRPQGFDEL